MRTCALAAPALACGLLLGAPGPAHAQLGGVESLLRRITDVVVYGGWGGFLPASDVFTTGEPAQAARQAGLSSFGVELTFEVGEVTRAAPAPADTSADPAAPPSVDTADAAAPPPVRTWLFELAVGYSLTGGFRAQGENHDLRGSVREAPSVSMYASRMPDRTVAPYVGLRSGLIQFDAQAYQLRDDAGTVSTGTAQAFQFGPVLGVAAGGDVLSVYVEASYLVRYFPVVRWTPVSNRVPLEYPRDARFSAWGLQAGIQIPFQRAK